MVDKSRADNRQHSPEPEPSGNYSAVVYMQREGFIILSVVTATGGHLEEPFASTFE